jgi:hypothetical protein
VVAVVRFLQAREFGGQTGQPRGREHDEQRSAVLADISLEHVGAGR